MKRQSKNLCSSLEHGLSSYALAASAAGVGLLALAQPAEGKVVYTKAHAKVRINRTLLLDLNHDGISDFKIFNRTHNSTTPFGDYLSASAPNSGNEIWVQATSRGFSNYADALGAGVRIGPSAKRFHGGKGLMAFWSLRASGTVSGGPWKNVRNRFLGLKFLIKGKAHYGWARLNVAIANTNVGAVLTGYAYETIPNKPIIAGRTKGKDVITVKPASLGALAAGANGLHTWR